jgi:hypothetical protein
MACTSFVSLSLTSWAARLTMCSLAKESDAESKFLSPAAARKRMDCISGVIPPTRGPWDDAGRLKTVVHHPAILPPYMRRSKSIETLLPALYLNCISTGDFSEALAALLDTETAGPSASTIGRLKVSVNHSPRLG